MTLVQEDRGAGPETSAEHTRITAKRLRSHLEELAGQRVPIAYRELAKALRLSPPRTIHQVTQALERVMQEDAAASRPFIAALAISRARGGRPASGFFDRARQLRRFAGDDEGPEASAYHSKSSTPQWGSGRSPSGG